MLSHVLRNHKVKASIIILVSIVIAVVAVHHLPPIAVPVNAQTEQSSLQSVFERMVERRQEDRGFIVVIEFGVPLVADENYWTIGDPNDRYRRSIIEIGSDYVCFRERDDSGGYIRCTPFSNIVGINYLEN